MTSEILGGSVQRVPIAHLSSVHASIVELVVQRRAVERAALLPADRLRLAAGVLAAADARLSAVPGVGEAGSSAVTATLAKESIALMVRAAAMVAPSSSDSPLAPADVARKLRAMCLDPMARAPIQWQLAVDAMEASDPLELDRAKVDDIAAAATALIEVAQWLRPRIDVRTPHEIRWAVRLRLAGLVLAALALPLFSIRSALRLPNLALDKPVAMSSINYRSAPAPALVDGHLSSRWTSRQSYGQLDFVQTNTEASPTATIDLGEVRSIREIRVYNRSDGYYDEGLPYVVELSTDGKTFHVIGERRDHFGSTIFDPPWKTDVAWKQGRYVRIRCHVYLALAEVEVFGR